ncbi:MAG: DUF3524 domain-containing protein [Planctomycetes bacterium]|nr:DUF3524 domain-containing protein [Planctomycetota bacterium]
MARMARIATDNPARALTVGAVEPYFGGSHKQFLEDLAAHSRHRFEFFTQPARKWKWRMRGSALHFLGEVERLGACDLLLVSDFLNLAEFLGLARGRWPRGAPPPIAMFMHENQLTYPVRHEDERDYHYGFINIVGCLAADEVWFNSAFHRDEFLAAAPAFLKRMPDAVPKGLSEALALRARVLHLGAAAPAQDPPPRARQAPLRIGWNHRWEFDKNPEAFFAALFALHDGGVPFEAVVLGERYRDSPAVFEEARVRLGQRIAHWGFAPSRADYARLLASCDVTVSTAAHEFFGLSTVEACLHGCAVLLPNRLSYPELVPPERHARVLYRDDADLVERLRAYAAAPESARALGAELRADFARFAWPERIAAFDDAVAALAAR